MSHSQDDGAEAHARGGSHGGQCRRQGCDDDAQRNLNDLRFQFHGSNVNFVFFLKRIILINFYFDHEFLLIKFVRKLRTIRIIRF